MGYSQDTICVQGGWQPKNGEPRVLPIYQSTTFKYATSEEMGKLFDLEEEGYFYSRLQNPTNDVVAQKICDLEGGVAAMLTSSGQAATMLAVTNICEAGDHVVCAAKVYGGTSNLLAVTLKRFGIETTLVDQDAPAEELEKAFQPKKNWKNTLNRIQKQYLPRQFPTRQVLYLTLTSLLNLHMSTAFR